MPPCKHQLEAERLRKLLEMRNQVNMMDLKELRKSLDRIDALTKEGDLLRVGLKVALDENLNLVDDSNRFPTLAEFSNLQDDYEALQKKNTRLRKALEAIESVAGCTSRHGPGCTNECRFIARAALNAKENP